MRIALTAGYTRSLHAIALIHQLATRAHQVVLCLEVRALSRARLRVYLRQLGWRKLWSKVRSRLLTRGSGSTLAEEVAPMWRYVQACQITSRTVSQACRSVDADHVRVSNLNAPRALAALRTVQPDLVVYAGGGILRREFLETPRLGVLNAHGGPLPTFRGMNACEWALFYGVRPTVTVHWMDVGIDTGPTLLERPVPTHVWSSIARGRGESARISVEAMLEAVQQIAQGKLQAVPQGRDAGRQFFVMADPLLEVLERWLSEGKTPTLEARAFAFPSLDRAGRADANEQAR